MTTTTAQAREAERASKAQRFRGRNGHEWDTHTDKTVTELKRGLPCPTCNPEAE